MDPSPGIPYPNGNGANGAAIEGWLAPPSFSQHLPFDQTFPLEFGARRLDRVQLFFATGEFLLNQFS
jgi:hypothetical protein